MLSRVRNVLALMRGQLWILPTLISVAAAALALVMLRTDLAYLRPSASELWWLYSGDADSARGLLSSLLSGLMTMTSLVVSVTFVILTLASSQLGPRLVWSFIGDRQIQTILGLFLGAIIYTLIVLRSLGDTLGEKGVPHLAVTTASAFTIVCLLALLFYIHKVARAVVADTVVDKVAAELRSAVRAIGRAEGARGPDGSALPSRPRPPSALPPALGTVALDRCGYVQTVDYHALVELACREDLVLRVGVRAGHFVLRQGEHVAVHGRRPPGSDPGPDGGPGPRSVAIPDGETAEAIRKAFVIGAERSPAQDLEHALRRLVEIALRALSPGINDPFTAIAVLDRLGAALEDLLGRELPPAVLQDEAGEVRVLADRSDIAGILDAAFNQIRQAAEEHPAVLIHLADTLGRLAPALAGDAARRAVLQQLARLDQTARLASAAADDREATLARIAQARIAVAALLAVGERV